MLHHLSIKDVAIVDAVDIELEPGMTVITGETGAGKSLLVDALHLLLGGRADSSLVRSGARQAIVSGLFSLGRGAHSDRVRATLDAVGVALDTSAAGGSGELLVRRTVAAAGRGRAFLNDVPVTVGTLAAVMEGVVDIMSQHEHQSLTSVDQQLALLDAFGDCGAQRTRVAEGHEQLRGLLGEQARLAASEAEKAARIEYLSYQIEELELAGPGQGELAGLEEEQRKLGSLDKLREQVGTAEARLYSDDTSAVGLLDQALKQVTHAASLAPELEPSRRAVDEARTLAADAARDLTGFLARLEADPARLESLNARIDLLRRLARKHAVESDLLGERLASLRAELEGLQNAASRLATLEDEVAAAKAALARVADQLSAARAKAATRLMRRCGQELKRLAMAEARIEVDLQALPPRGDEQAVLVGDEDGQPGRRVARHGADRVELRLQANPGEPPRSLAKVASGGELSRVALALRRALADRDPVPTYVFDEIDAAIGGATAEAVGEALREVAHDHQVLCVSHLPQVAALAGQHLHVEKTAHGKRTAVTVRALEGKDRVEELARMLSGAKPAATARRHARAMLKEAGL